MIRPKAPPKNRPSWTRRDLTGEIALVAGATRGAGRGIALALGECRVRVYCTGRSIRGNPGLDGRPESIQETVDLIKRNGGSAVAVRVDHTDPTQVRRLFARIKKLEGRLDILVNDVWGGDSLTEWGKSFWKHSLDKGLTMLVRAIHSHIITAHYAAPLLLKSKGIIVEITDGTNEANRDYRGNLFYDLVKTSVNRLALGMAAELKRYGVTALGVTPGFLRSEAMLDHFEVKETNWEDAIKKDPYFAWSESPAYVGRAVACLVADPKVMRLTGGSFASWNLAKQYGFTDYDGRRPNWDEAMALYRRRKRGK